MEHGPYQAHLPRGVRMTIVPTVFPSSWGWRRMAEIQLSLYQFGVGVLYWLWPDTLRHAVYRDLLAIMEPSNWAISLWCVCIGHVSAIYLNGRMPLVSAPVRFLACLAHFGVVVAIIKAFLSAGAYWPVWSYLALVGWLVWGAMSTALDDIWTAVKWRRGVGTWKS